jgi:hypothetical protein
VLGVLEHRALHRTYYFTALQLWTGIGGNAWGTNVIGNLKLRITGSILVRRR